MSTVRWPPWLIRLLLLTGMLAPIWMGRYAPAFDYANHLLEAQIVAHYTDARYGFAESYEIRPNWYWETNSLSTLVLAELGRWLPMTLAGHLVLSLYLVLFFGGYALLLRASGTAQPFIWLAPVLAYSFPFTAGWINFCYGITLGLYALVLYRRWRSHPGWFALGAMALLLWLIYLSHLMAWLLVVIVIAAVAGTDAFQWRRHGPLWLALASTLAPMALTWPALALGAATVVPGTWGLTSIVRWLRLGPRQIAAATLSAAALALAALKLGKESLKTLFPDFGADVFSKFSNLLRVFTLPPQFGPTGLLLDLYNWGALLFILIVAVLLLWGVLHRARSAQTDTPWLAALPLLILLYVFLPGQTPYLRATEVRTAWWAALVTLASVPWPAADHRLYRGLRLCAVGFCLFSLGGLTLYAQLYEQQVRRWEAELSALTPARHILVFSPEREEADVPLFQRLLDPFYRGVNFSATYTLHYGGFVSQTFNNGPVRPRATLPTPFYYWDDAENIEFVAGHCAALREAYEAVLVWGRPSPTFGQTLQHCFGDSTALPNLTIWHIMDRPLEIK
jgi:hypothetical protein